jgi:hypothetical protein
MVIQRLSPALFGLMLFSGLTAPSLAVPLAAQPNSTSKQNSSVQHLTCLQDAQGLMCTVDQTVNRAASSNVESVAAQSDRSASGSLPNQQLGQAANLLLAVIYLGLPVVLGFAIFRHDKQNAERAQFVERLERIWKSSQP